MDLTPYVENVRHELAVTAETGGDDVRALAERLTASLDSAFRLAMLEALSAAAAEITEELKSGSVELQLRGREATFAVNVPQAPQLEEGAAEPAAATHAATSWNDDGPTVRINLRLPEELKRQIEEAAALEKLSINAWLVRAAASFMDYSGVNGRSGRRGAYDDHVKGWMR